MSPSFHPVLDVIGKTHIGKVVDVDNDGVLILKNDQGMLQRIFSGLA